MRKLENVETKNSEILYCFKSNTSLIFRVFNSAKEIKRSRNYLQKFEVISDLLSFKNFENDGSKIFLFCSKM